MANSAKYLLIGSIEAYSGKSGTILGIAHQLQEKGLAIAYAKPIGTCFGDDSSDGGEADVEFMAQSLELSDNQVRSPLLNLNDDSIKKRIQGEDDSDYSQSLNSYVESITADIIIIEGPSTLAEGSLFHLSTRQIAQTLSASIVLVVRYTSPVLVDNLLKAKEDLGDSLIGVVINDIPPEQFEELETLVKPFLESQSIPVFATLPRSRLLRSVSVREIAKQLKADILCRHDRLDLMVESLTIGAMNVNSALEYFRKGFNKAVVTGGDRTDLQLAALETSTSCLILTGHLPPQPLIISRAEDLEVPILSVDLDTLTTVEIVDQAFGKVRIQEKIKVECILDLMAQHFQIERLIEKLA